MAIVVRTLTTRKGGVVAELLRRQADRRGDRRHGVLGVRGAAVRHPDHRAEGLEETPAGNHPGEDRRHEASQYRLAYSITVANAPPGASASTSTTTHATSLLRQDLANSATSAGFFTLGNHSRLRRLPRWYPMAKKMGTTLESRDL